MEKNTDRLYTLIITTIIGILFLGGITYGIFQAAHTMLNSQANTTAMRDRTTISKQNVSSDLAAITNANIKFNGKDPITGQKVIKEFTKDGLNYSVNTDTSTVSITGMTDDALSTDNSEHISLTIPKTVTDSQNKSYTITSIADQAFMNRKIYHVTLPDSIVYIGAQAFYNSHLGDLTQDGKFDDVAIDQYDQGSDRNLTIPSDIKFIGREAFANNYLYSITIPDADDLASLNATATDNNAITYKSADQINTSPVDIQHANAFVNLQYSSANAYDKRVDLSSTQKYLFISGTYRDDFIIAKRPAGFDQITNETSENDYVTITQNGRDDGLYANGPYMTSADTADVSQKTAVPYNGQTVQLLGEAQTTRATWVHIKLADGSTWWMDKRGVTPYVYDQITSRKAVNYNATITYDRNDGLYHDGPYMTGPTTYEIATQTTESLHGQHVQVIAEAVTGGNNVTWVQIKLADGSTWWMDKRGIQA